MSGILLKSLDHRFKHGFIIVRASRMWEYRGGKDDGELRHIDLVLLDCDGSAMYAEIGIDALDQKGPLITKGRVYKMQRFRVIDAKRNYRAVDCQFMIDITMHTIIDEQTDFPEDFPMYTYKLINFPDLPTLAGETRSFVDIMGIITEITSLEHVHLQNQATPTIRRCITLRDDSDYEMKLFLWGRRASEFDAERLFKMSEQKPIVAIFVGLLVKTFKGDICLSGNSSSRWYINAEVPEVQSFIHRIQSDFHPITTSAAETASCPRQEPVPEPEMKSLVEIKAISPYDFPPEGFRCTITVSRIN